MKFLNRNSKILNRKLKMILTKTQSPCKSAECMQDKKQKTDKRINGLKKQKNRQKD